MGESLKLRTPADWAAVSEEEVVRAGGRPLLALYGGSLRAALTSLLPDKAPPAGEEGAAATASASASAATAEVQEGSKAERVPRGHWADAANVREFMDKIAAAHGLREASDWRRVTEEDVRAAGGAGLLKRHGQSLGTLLQAAYGPGHGAHRCRPKVPRHYWSEPANQRRFLDEVASALDVHTPEDWARVRHEDIAARGGRGLLARFGTVLATLRAVYPEQDWAPLECRQRAPQGHWERAEERRAFMERAAAELGVRTAEDWRQVSFQRLAESGGRTLLQRYDNSVFRLLRDVYPEQDLQVHQCRRKVPQGHWSSQPNRRAFLEHVGRRCGVRAPEDWADVTAERVIELGGAELIRRNGGVLEALQDAFPEQAAAWDMVRCRPSVPLEYWRDAANVRRFLDGVKERHRISSPEDWHRISVQQLREAKGGGLLRQYSLLEALRIAYPDDRWDNADFAAGKAKKSMQRELLLAVRQLLAAEGPAVGVEAAAAP